MKKLLYECKAEIVLSSDWRLTNDLDKMRRLFKIHKLDAYLTELVPATGRFSDKIVDIKAYLEEHPKLDKYVVVDDRYMGKEFKGRFVLSKGILTQLSYNQMYRLLKYGPWWNDKYYEEYTNGDIGNTIEDRFEKVVFLDIDGVLNDDGPARRQGVIIDDAFMFSLRRIVDSTGAEIVISSSWRNGIARDMIYGSDNDKGLTQLYDAFKKYHLVISGATPLIYNGPNGRPLEIRTWLTKRPGIKRFAILDDETFWNWGWLEPFVVTTSRILPHEKGRSCLDERICGLNEEYANIAINMLLDWKNNNADAAG